MLRKSLKPKFNIVISQEQITRFKRVNIRWPRCSLWQLNFFSLISFWFICIKYFFLEVLFNMTLERSLSSVVSDSLGIAKVCPNIIAVHLVVSSLQKKHVAHRAPYACIVLARLGHILSGEFTVMTSEWRYVAPLMKTNTSSNSYTIAWWNIAAVCCDVCLVIHWMYCFMQ